MIQRELEGTWLDLVGEHHRQQQGVAVNGLVAGHGTWISGRCPSNASCTAKDDDQPINRRLFAQPQRRSERPARLFAHVRSTAGLAIVFDDDTGSNFSSLAGELKTTLAELLVFEHGLTFRGVQITATKQSLAIAAAKFLLEGLNELLGCGV